MKITKRIGALALVCGAMAVSGCVSTPTLSTRNVVLDDAPTVAASQAVRQDWTLASLVVNVPRTLTVSEAAHQFKPRADIVWREDPLGDRYQQVEGILRGALEGQLGRMSGSVPVQVQIDVTRFHAQTERARYTVGGEHEIEFVLTVRHAETGAILSGPRPVDLTFRAYGGQAAIEAEARGETQRVRISQRVAAWAQSEFVGGAVLASN
jgi:hypothetical protein